MKNVIFAGVGGQGVILASKILMDVAKSAGYDVKESEVHGMAQRGGSVDCHVRYGEKVYSPLIGRGMADYVVSLELLESMRKVEYLASEGMVLVNSDRIDPAPVATGAMSYPDNIESWLKKNVKKSCIVETKDILREVGNRKALNVVMLGVLSKYLEFSDEQWEKAIKNQVKEKFIDLNLKAFNSGRSMDL